jgi:hypothetical protein
MSKTLDTDWKNCAARIAIKGEAIWTRANSEAEAKRAARAAVKEMES